MLAIQIEDVKPFMNRLFLTDYFDAFFCSDAVFTTFTTFHIDGTLKKDYYSQEELETQELQDQHTITWRQLRPFALELIKGKHTPLEFKLVFRLSASNTAKLLTQSGLSYTPGDVSGLFLNIHFQTGSLTCTTGTAMNLFTLDKSLDHVWDDMVKRFLSKI